MKIFSLNPDQLEGLIFDIDLTLYDNRHYYAAQEQLLLDRLATELKLDSASVSDEIGSYREQERKRTGSRPALGPTMAARYGISIERICIWREELFHPEDYLCRDEQLIEVMDRLARRFKIAAVTNNPTTIGRRTLKTLAVEAYFSPVIGLDIARESKPAITAFNMVVEAFGCRHDNVVSIGDRYEIDLELPLRHGMGGILIESLQDIYQLPELLDATSRR